MHLRSSRRFTSYNDDDDVAAAAAAAAAAADDDDNNNNNNNAMHLFQWVSLAVERYNSVAFKSTFSVSAELDYSATPVNYVFNLF